MTLNQYDTIIQDIADYVLQPLYKSEDAIKTCCYALLDSMGCAVAALNYSECTKLLGPLFESSHPENGIPAPGTHHHLDPLQATFNFTAMIRWLDYNDTWLAKEWGAPF